MTLFSAARASLTTILSHGCVIEGCNRNKTDSPAFSPDKYYYQYRRRVARGLDVVVPFLKVPNDNVNVNTLSTLDRMLFDCRLPAAQ